LPVQLHKFLFLTAFFSLCLTACGGSSNSSSNTNEIPIEFIQDDDDDGVANEDDAFPNDIAASKDSDADGFPDVWNAGYSEQNSTTGLILDLFPYDPEESKDTDKDGVGDNTDYYTNDGLCSLQQDGNDEQCYFISQDTKFGKIKRVITIGHKMLFFNPGWDEILRFNTQTMQFESGFMVEGATDIAYNTWEKRVFVSFETGEVKYIYGPGLLAIHARVSGVISNILPIGMNDNFLFVDSQYASESKANIFYRETLTPGECNNCEFEGTLIWSDTTEHIYYRKKNENKYFYSRFIDTRHQGNDGFIDTEQRYYLGEENPELEMVLSPDGNELLFSNGMVFNFASEVLEQRFDLSFTQALWLSNEFVYYITGSPHTPTLVKYHLANGKTEQTILRGEVHRLINVNSKIAVILKHNDKSILLTDFDYSDSDHDGITNSEDAFPTDPSASLDTDLDTYPDSWNEGYSQLDSISGLSLDLFPLDPTEYADHDLDGIGDVSDLDDDNDGTPDLDDIYPFDSEESKDTDQDGVGDNTDYYPNDPACYLQQDGDGAACYLTWMAKDGIQTIEALQTHVAFFNPLWDKIYIYNPVTTHFIATVDIDGATDILYSEAHKRLYVSFKSGIVGYIDPEWQIVSLMAMSHSVEHLQYLGNFVGLVSDSDSYSMSSNGSVKPLPYGTVSKYSNQVWNDPLSSIITYSGDTISSKGVNQTTASIDSELESTRHYSLSNKMLISPDGFKILIDDGEVMNGSTLETLSYFDIEFDSAIWIDESYIAYIPASNEDNVVSVINLKKSFTQSFPFTGENIDILRLGEQIYHVSNTGTQISISSIDYLNNDEDGDGVPDSLDAFPADFTASIDTDSDGYPDQFHDGYSAVDSVSQLQLDYFPEDLVCWLDTHSKEGQCNYSATVPSSKPTDTMHKDGIVYMLFSNSTLLYRYSLETNNYLSPIQIGLFNGIRNYGAKGLAFSEDNQRIILGYPNGEITFLNESNQMSYLTNVHRKLINIFSQGDFVGVTTEQGEYVGCYSGYSVKLLVNGIGEVTDLICGGEGKLGFQKDKSRATSVYGYLNIDFNTGKWLRPWVLWDENSNLALLTFSPDGTKYITRSNVMLFQEYPVALAEIEQSNHAIWTPAGLVTAYYGYTNELTLYNWFEPEYGLAQKIKFDGDFLTFASHQGETYLVRFDRFGTGKVYFDTIGLVDKDDDTLPLWWEELYGLSDLDQADADIDSDNDSLTNAQEFQFRTNPTLADTDKDGLNDNDEITIYKTSPILADSDSDRLNDFDEVMLYKTDPNDADSDQDELKDYDEIKFHFTNPLLADSDNDGINDNIELEFDLDPLLDDAADDKDQDGLTNIEELNLGTTPNNADSDYDGLLDGEEVNTYSTDPLNRDSDNDQMRDDFEALYRLEPLSNADAELDSDNDGYTNKEEYFLKTSPVDVNSTPYIKGWMAYRGNTGRNPFVPIKVDVESIVEKWRVPFSRPIKQGNLLATQDQIFVSSRREDSSPELVTALKIADGSILWEKPVPGGQMMLHNSYLYVSNNNRFLALNSFNGGTLFEHETRDFFDFNVGLSRPLTVYKNRITVDYSHYSDISESTLHIDLSGKVDGFYGHDQCCEYGRSDSSMSSNDETYSYSSSSAFGNDEFRESSGLRGTLANGKSTRIKVANLDFFKIPVIGSDRFVSANYANKVYQFDFNKGEVVWSQDASGVASPYSAGLNLASAFGQVYFVNGNTLHSVNESSGETIWSWTPAVGNFEWDFYIQSRLAVTRNILFATTSEKTYAIDTKNGAVLWEFDETGALFVSNHGVLLIATEQELIAFDLGLDSNNDNLPDWWAQHYAVDDANADTDEDGLTALEEYHYATSPNEADSDFDELNDGAEVNNFNSNPLQPDTDLDGISDALEVNTFGTSPDKKDTDEDGIDDDREITVYNTDPLDSNSKTEKLTAYEQSFESLPTNFDNQTTEIKWQISDDDHSEGIQSIKVTSDNSTFVSDLVWDVETSKGTLSFDAKTLFMENGLEVSRIYGTYLQMLIDGKAVSNYLRLSEWKSISADIEEGDHRIIWRLLDDDKSEGEISAWIDNIIFIPE
jgi:hypothetical protein